MDDRHAVCRLAIRAEGVHDELSTCHSAIRLLPHLGDAAAVLGMRGSVVEQSVALRSPSPPERDEGDDAADAERTEDADDDADGDEH